MEKVRCIFGGLLIIISICILFAFVAALLLPTFNFTVRNILIDLLSMCAFCISGFYFIASCLDNRLEQERLMQCSIAMIIMTYIVTLGLLLKANSLLVQDRSKIVGYDWKDYVQMIPFHTIRYHISLLIHKKVTFQHEFIVICEHIFKFAPLGFVLPFAYSKCNRTWFMLWTATLSILGYGTLELSLKAGMQDIDYLILNVLGVYLSFRLLNWNPIKRLLWKLYILKEADIYFEDEV